MVWFVSVGGAILALLLVMLCVLLFVRWSITIIVQNKHVQVKAWRWAVYDSQKKERPQQDAGGQKADFIKVPTINGLKKLLKRGKEQWRAERPHVQEILRKLNRAIRFTRVDLAVDYGLGDAALTGVANGALWTLISNIVCLLEQYADIRRVTNIALCPNYTESVFGMHLEVKCSFRLCRLISSAWAIYKLQKRVKGGMCHGTV